MDAKRGLTHPEKAKKCKEIRQSRALPSTSSCGSSISPVSNGLILLIYDLVSHSGRILAKD